MDKSRENNSHHSQPQIHPPKVEIGNYELDTWYSSPYPAEYVSGDKIFVCEFCLSYMKCHFTLSRHNMKCPSYCPPANEIYRTKHEITNLGTTELSVYEVDGAKSKLYCQNLCLLAKLFINHKTLYYDVDHFLFYILTINDHIGSRIVGYFSKEKHARLKNNVSCIMVLPQYQGFGFGRYLIEFSYLLTKKENSLGSPEKPLSELGRISYTSYWKYSILKVFEQFEKENIQCASIQDISERTSMRQEDVESVLQDDLKILRPNKKGLFIKDKYKVAEPKISVNAQDLRWTQYVSKYAKMRIKDEDEEDEEQEANNHDQNDNEDVKNVKNVKNINNIIKNGGHEDVINNNNDDGDDDDDETDIDDVTVISESFGEDSRGISTLSQCIGLSKSLASN